MTKHPGDRRAVAMTRPLVSWAGLLALVVATVGLFAFASTAGATTAHDVEGQLANRSLSPVPLFPTWLPASTSHSGWYLRVGRHAEFDTETTRTPNGYILTFSFGRGPRSDLHALMRDARRRPDIGITPTRVRRVRIGRRLVYSFRTFNAHILAWREQGYTYSVIGSYYGLTSAELWHVVRSLQPLRVPVPGPSGG